MEVWFEGVEEGSKLHLEFFVSFRRAFDSPVSLKELGALLDSATSHHSINVTMSASLSGGVPFKIPDCRMI